MRADHSTLAARLRAAREARGLTQAQAAAELGVSRPLLIAMEKGDREVQDDQLITLARLYSKPVSELLRPTAPPLAIGARFRAVLASAPETDKLPQLITRLEELADNYLDLLRRAHAEPSGQYPPLRKIDHLNPEQAAEDLATEERNRLSLGDGPVQGLREMLEVDVGLRIFVEPLPSRVAGLFVFIESLGGCVAVNSLHPPERRDWTLAHEYAHFLISRDRAEVTIVGHRRQLPDTERFADAFAANFLMPRSGLSRRFNELKRSNAGQVTAATLVQIAHTYHVSVQALTLRLEDCASSALERGTGSKTRTSSPALQRRCSDCKPTTSSTASRCRFTTASWQPSSTQTARLPKANSPDTSAPTSSAAAASIRNSPRPGISPTKAPSRSSISRPSGDP